MAAFDQEKDSAGQQGPRTASSDNLLEDFAVRTLRMMKKSRDEIDAAVPKILTLTDQQRMEISMRATLTGVMLTPLIGRTLAMPLSPNEKPLVLPPNKRVVALNSISKALSVDTSKMSPNQRKEYAAMVKQVWKTAKATLDETLEKPDVKDLLNQSGK